MDLADKTLHKLKQCIRENRYIMTLHAEEEMDDDERSIFNSGQNKSYRKNGHHYCISRLIIMLILLCDNCGKEGARIRHVTRSYGKGKSLLIIENIPIISCPHCEVSYMTAETLHEIARIK